MSDKNGHRGAQWSKAAAASVAEERGQKQLATHAPYDLTSGLLSASVLYNPGVGRGVLAGVVGGGPPHSDPITASYARFQVPSIHHAPGPPPSTPSLLSHPSLATSAISNVPGFIPPTLPATPTSVLTPNPFAVTVSSIVGGGGSGGAASSNAFGLDQFQQFELSKIMNAMNPATAASLASTAAAAAATPAMPLTLGNAAGGTITAPPASHMSQPPVSHATSRQHAEGSSPANSGAISSTITENVLNAISTGPNASITAANVAPVHGRLLGLGVRVPDEDKMRRIQNVVESGVSEHAKQQILQIVDRISTLKPVEKLLLYLRLPGEAPETDPLRHPQNPLGTRSEINHTINWVRSHLEHDPQVSIPKQDVYNDYLSYCERLDIKPLSTADFGKVMKQVFPGIRPRRLGTRGHSRYCYAAMRKTTKLTAPQLPALSNSIAATAVAGTSDGNTEFGASSMPLHEANTESWDIVKTWAENLLHVKVENVCELAAHIKSNNNIGVATGGATPVLGNARGTATHKKYAPREPKEKRFLADMGPLKKRRKKKRKGSSSSESSCNLQPLANSSNSSNINNNNIDDSSKHLVSPNATIGYAAGSSMEVTSQEQEQEQQSIKMVRVKEEIMDSPNYARVQQLPVTPHMQQATTSTLPDNYLNQLQHHHQQQQQQQQQQTLPMNLATEQRGVLAKAPPAAVNLANMRIPVSAVKNLTPKIMKMSHASTASSIVSSLQQQQQQQHQQEIPAIKEEVTDEYNTTNIFCKKVRKAQQTKGFWHNSPTPVITTTASSPPAVATSVIAASSIGGPTHHQQHNSGDGGASSNYVMGPPASAQLTHAHNSASPIVSTVTLEVASNSAASSVARVASRNMLQLRLKKQLLLQQQQQQNSEAGSADIGVDNKDAAYLPDNLGLPRERVISICNMDKHELDDYFPPLAGQGEDEEEDNSQDQDTELLQYFQTGDAEEKLNSLDDAAKLRNPTAAQMHMQTPTTTTSTSDNGNGQQEKQRASSKVESDSATQQKAFTATAVNTLSSGAVGGVSIAAAEVRNASAAASISANATVGSASASLALMSQKHQQQQQQHHQQQQQLLQQQQQHNNINVYNNNNNNGNKRKIQLNANTTVNYAEMASVRRNCIFLPISPNINNGGGGGSAVAHVVYNNNVSDSTGFFASPGGMGVTRLRPKPAFSKQQSLDFNAGSEGSDPMICATRRRRRSYVSAMPNNCTGSINSSASAPPSPSVLQQQQQHLYDTHHLLGNQWPASLINTNHTHSSVYSNAAAALLNEQNSLDLDLFGAVTSGNGSGAASYGPNTTLALDTATEECHLVSIGSEMQRSQSVPLSQLQRIHSPTFNRSGFLQGAAYSACTSVTQTPVPPELVESTLFSENSNSQQSVGCGQSASAVIKLEEAGVLASDSTAMLDEVDVSDILASTDFVTKFSRIAQVHTATTTTCSSAGSSSGYSSVGGAGTNFGSGVNFAAMGSICVGGGGGNGGCGIVSRSVPSTPLPHHHQNLFSHNQNFFGRSSAHNNDELHLSPTAASSAYTTAFRTSSKYCSSSGSMNATRRSTCDMSKSMPTTPITTPCFRYSPTEFTRDFLINGNTIDSINSFGTDNLMGGGGSSTGVAADSLGVSRVSDELIDGNGHVSGADADLVGSDFLGDL